MNKLRSLSLFVGTDYCNANCNDCAGIPLRGNAPKKDGVINEDLIYKTIKECYGLGARSLSISSAGEPTRSPLAVTKTLQLVQESNVKFNPINIYSNGIRIGKDEKFSNEFLPVWKNLGLTTFYVTVHDVDEKENAFIYQIKKYPSLDLIISRIHDSDLLMRANLVLNKKTIGTLEKFVSTVDSLREKGVDYVSAWPIRDKNDKVDGNLAPSVEEIGKMQEWVQEKGYGNIRIFDGRNREMYESGEKLTLFPNGVLSNTWCN